MSSDDPMRDVTYEELRARVIPVESEAVTAKRIVAWLRGRTGAHGGGFTCADDVADAIEWEFGQGTSQERVIPERALREFIDGERLRQGSEDTLRENTTLLNHLARLLDEYTAKAPSEGPSSSGGER